MEDGSAGAITGIDVLVPAPARHANATVHFLGGLSLDVVQAPGVAGNRIEAAHDDPGRCASLTDARGKVAFINPAGITYIEQRTVPDQADAYLVGAPREGKARVHFPDGSALDVIQGISIVNKRLEESRASAGLFAYLTQSSGTPIYINRLAITHLTADPV